MASGALEFDRRWAIVDASYNFVNGKQCVEIHRIRAEFAPDVSQVRISAGAHAGSFSLPAETRQLAALVSEILGRSCRLVENAVVGHPDELDSPGPTVISTATLARIASWYEGVTLEEMRRRLRANLELDADEPFWEDQLALRGNEQGPEFAIGDVRLRGWHICARCIVPTRDSQTGEQIPRFAKNFGERRAAELPAWSPADRFDHFYRAAINTRLPASASGGRLRVGDSLLLGG